MKTVLGTYISPHLMAKDEVSSVLDKMGSQHMYKLVQGEVVLIHLEC